jgi:DNA-binding Lrp family transcriptional regulator
MDRDSLKRILEKEPHGAIDRYLLEKDLSDKYGSEGIKIYLLVDGAATAEEIMKKIGMNEEKFIEVVTYMESIDMLKAGESQPKPLEVEAQQPVKPTEEPPPIPLIKTEGFVEAGEKSSALKALVASEMPQAEPVKPPTHPKSLKAYAKPRTPKTPMEKKLYAKFGDDGLNAYSLIDEFKTPREIVKETGISEERLREIIKFMEDEGIIKLEKPVEEMAKPPARIDEPAPLEEKPKPVKPPAAPPQPTVIAPPPKPVAPPPHPLVAVLQPKPVTAPPPKPTVAPPKPVEKPAPQVIRPPPFNKNEVCVPTALPLKLVTKLKIEGELLRRYGNDGFRTLSLMNGKRVNVKIMKELKMNPPKFDDIASFLAENGAIKVQCLTAENIRELYGDEGFAIYNKYGRDGILLYEFIDKKSSLKDIVKMSGIDPKLAVEMFTFIHKVLGLDIPIDTELLYKQLGINL